MRRTAPLVAANLRSRRDLRAAIASLAFKAAGTTSVVTLSIVAPAISEEAIVADWSSFARILRPDLRRRMAYRIDDPNLRTKASLERVAVGRPNYPFEVIRLLINDRLEGEAGSLGHLIERIGASQTPIRAAIESLRAAGLLRAGRGRPELQFEPGSLSGDDLGRVGALPRQVRLRFERGSTIKPPVALIARAASLIEKAAQGWDRIALSGVPVAQADHPRIDIAGCPRLDLIVRVPRQDVDFDIGPLRDLDQGLEVEPSPIAPAPIVLTIIRADVVGDRRTSACRRCAPSGDVFMALLDLGLRECAIDYAKSWRSGRRQSRGSSRK